MADEAMSDMRFCTTPKGGLPNKSCIFRKPEPLGTEINNVDFSRLGTMIYLETQKGKETMTTEKFQQQTRGTVACTNRIIMAKMGGTNWCQMTSTFMIAVSVELKLLWR